MWPGEKGERVIIPWHEASCFVPPFRWFHQHFNVSTNPDRYLAIHTGIPAVVADDPQTTVVRGTGVALENFEVLKRNQSYLR